MVERRLSAEFATTPSSAFFRLYIGISSSRLAEAGSRPGAFLRWLLLSIQVTVLGLAIFVRGSPIYLLVPVCAVAAFALLKRRRTSEPRSTLMRLVAPATLLAILLGALPPLAFPDYAKSGRLFNSVWSHLLLSLGAHPAWPFPGVRDEYPCPEEIPEGGVTPGIADRNGYSVWCSYVRSHGLPRIEAVRKRYDADYEEVMREAFFQIALAHPREVLETFLYYKPIMGYNTILYMLRLEWSDATRAIAPLCGLQVLLMVVLIGRWQTATPLREAMRGGSVLALFLLASLIPQLAAWTTPATGVDLFVYMLCGCEIGMWLAISYALRVVPAMFGSIPKSETATSNQLTGPLS
jgi:hypothetical protein